ncbi:MULTISPECIES: hypothetical protein [unclassified Microbacterium]
MTAPTVETPDPFARLRWLMDQLDRRLAEFAGEEARNDPHA